MRTIMIVVPLFLLFGFIFGQIPEGYHSPEEIFTEFSTISEKYPGITELFALQDVLPNITTTWDGNKIWCIKISANVRTDDDQPNILLVANHHAREIINPEILLNTTLHLAENYGRDPMVTKLIDNYQIYVIWTMNPDGLNYVWKHNRFWRKNRRNNQDGTFGVDLNRNYDAGWNLSCAGNRTTFDDYYGGPSEASEPETRIMRAFQKERNFAMVLDYHSAAREVRYNYGCGKLPNQIESMMRSYAQDMAKQMNYNVAKSCCMGGNIAYAYMKHGSNALLIETFEGNGSFRHQPNWTLAQQEIARVLPGTLKALQWKIPIQGHITDLDGKPLEAVIHVNNLHFSFGETWKSHPKFGRFHLWIPMGNWTLKISKRGHVTQFYSVRVGDLNTQSINMQIALRPLDHISIYIGILLTIGIITISFTFMILWLLFCLSNHFMIKYQEPVEESTYDPDDMVYEEFQ